MLARPLTTRGRYERKFRLSGSPEVFKRFGRIAQQLGYRPDPYGEVGRYRIASLYFDTPDHACLAANVNGDHLHWKFRVRAYAPTGPLYCELKVKRGDLIFKYRARLPSVVAHVEAVRVTFRTIVERSGSQMLTTPALWASIPVLEPASIVSYTRHAFEAPGSQRVCLDTTLAFRPPSTDPAHWFLANEDASAGDACILESKAPPELVTRAAMIWGRFAQAETSRFSKYCESVTWLTNDAQGYRQDPMLRLPVTDGRRLAAPRAAPAPREAMRPEAPSGTGDDQALSDARRAAGSAR